MRVPLASLAAAFALASSASALGNVWVVDAAAGPGFDFTAIQPAVDAASPGDTILVRDGTYPSFSVFVKGLTIQAEAGAAPRAGTALVNSIASDQRVAIRGLEAHFDLGLCAGTIWLEDVVATGGTRVLGCRSVVIVRSTLHGVDGQTGPSSGTGGAALTIEGDNPFLAFETHVFESTLVGGQGAVADAPPPHTAPSPGSAGGPAVIASGELVTFHDCVLQGGAGGAGGVSGIACSAGGPGGTALVLDGSDVAFADVIALGGTGGPGGAASCSAGAIGTPLLFEAGHLTVEPAGDSRSLAATSPVREGQSLTVSATGEPGDFVFLGLSSAPAALELPTCTGLLLIGAPIVITTPGLVPPSGTLVFQAAIVDLGPGVEGIQAWVQGAFWRTFEPLHLASATAVTLLDAAF